MIIKLTNVRLSFPSIFRRAVFNGEEGKFEATFLINKETQGELIKQIREAVAEKIKTDLKGAKLPADRICVKDGDDVSYDGYYGHVSIKASSNKRVPVFNKDKTPVAEDDNVIYAGCYVNARIELWAQNNKWGKRINANLHGLQFAKDGQPFGDTAGASAEDFDFVEDSDDSDDIPF